MNKIQELEEKLNEQKIQSILRSSEVVRTLNELCFNFLSFDHKGHPNFNASAKYSVSFGSGQILEASLVKSSNSLKGTISSFEEIKENNNPIFSEESPDFFEISSSYFSNSSNKYSGMCKVNLFENNISAVLPTGEIRVEIIIFASTTKSINYLKDLSLNLLCNDLFTFLPISRASFSVNFDPETMDLNKANCESFFLIASLATADQFMSPNSSICFFNSSGIDKVIVGIFSLETFNLLNIFEIFNLFKTFGELKK